MTKHEVEEIVKACKRAIGMAIDLADAAYAARDERTGDKWGRIAGELCIRHTHWHAVLRNHQFTA